MPQELPLPVYTNLFTVGFGFVGFWSGEIGHTAACYISDYNSRLFESETITGSRCKKYLRLMIRKLNLCILFQLLNAFESFLLKITRFNPLICKLAQLFLRNEQGSPLRQMKVRPGLTPECKTLGAIVVHTAVAISSNLSQPFILPFVSMLTNPAALAVSMAPVFISKRAS